MFRPRLGLKAPALAWLSWAWACTFAEPGQGMWALAWPGLALAQAGAFVCRIKDVIHITANILYLR